ncbi:hypothetical protein [Dapis sp. BLCC M229]
MKVEKSGKIIQSVFSKTQENNFLKSFVTQIISHILPQEKKLEAVSTVAE